MIMEIHRIQPQVLSIQEIVARSQATIDNSNKYFEYKRNQFVLRF